MRRRAKYVNSIGTPRYLCRPASASASPATTPVIRSNSPLSPPPPPPLPPPSTYPPLPPFSPPPRLPSFSRCLPLSSLTLKFAPRLPSHHPPSPQPPSSLSILCLPLLPSAPLRVSSPYFLPPLEFLPPSFLLPRFPISYVVHPPSRVSFFAFLSPRFTAITPYFLPFLPSSYSPSLSFPLYFSFQSSFSLRYPFTYFLLFLVTLALFCFLVPSLLLSVSLSSLLYFPQSSSFTPTSSIPGPLYFLPSLPILPFSSPFQFSFPPLLFVLHSLFPPPSLPLPHSLFTSFYLFPVYPMPNQAAEGPLLFCWQEKHTLKLVEKNQYGCLGKCVNTYVHTCLGYHGCVIDHGFGTRKHRGTQM